MQLFSIDVETYLKKKQSLIMLNFKVEQTQTSDFKFSYH